MLGRSGSLSATKFESKCSDCSASPGDYGGTRISAGGQAVKQAPSGIDGICKTGVVPSERIDRTHVSSCSEVAKLAKPGKGYNRL